MFVWLRNNQKYNRWDGRNLNASYHWRKLKEFNSLCSVMSKLNIFELDEKLVTFSSLDLNPSELFFLTNRVLVSTRSDRKRNSRSIKHQLIELTEKNREFVLLERRSFIEGSSSVRQRSVLIVRHEIVHFTQTEQKCSVSRISSWKTDRSSSKNSIWEYFHRSLTVFKTKIRLDFVYGTA